MPGDLPTDFTKVAFDKLRNDMIKILDLKIGELTENADSSIGYKAIQKDVDTNERDLRGRVDSDQLKNTDYYYLGSYGFLSMTTVLLAALISLFFAARNAHFSGLFHEFFRCSPLLDLSTVFILALAIIMLGLTTKCHPRCSARCSEASRVMSLAAPAALRALLPSAPRSKIFLKANLQVTLVPRPSLEQ